MPAKVQLAGRDARERAHRLRDRHRGGELRTGAFMLDLTLIATHLARARMASGWDPRADGRMWPLSEVLLEARGPSTPKLVDQMVTSIDAVADQFHRGLLDGRPRSMLRLQVHSFAQAAALRRFRLSGISQEALAAALEDYVCSLA